MAPFAVVAPVVGPLLDRSRGGRRLLIVGSCLGRAVLCLLMAGTIDSLTLYPLAFAMLVLSKTQAVTKSSLVPGVVDHPDELVLANSRLALISVVGGDRGGPGRGRDPEARRARLGPALRRRDLRGRRDRGARHPAGQARRARGDARRPGAAPLPQHRHGRVCDGLVRGVVGFITFFAAFVLKKQGEPAWIYGLVLIGERGRQRRRHDHRPVAAPQVARGVDPRGIARRARDPAGLRRAFLRPGLARVRGRGGRGGRGIGRLAFDSLLQRDGAEAARGRAFARFETRFQLVWVIGGAACGRCSRVGVAPASSWSRSSCCSAGSRTSARCAAASRRREQRRRSRQPRRAARARTGRMTHRDPPITPDEVADMLAVDHRGFGQAPNAFGTGSSSWSEGELDRTRVAFEDGAIVGVSRAYSFELTMPGGALVPAAAVSWVVGAADAPPARRPHADDRRAARRRARARRTRRDPHRVGERHLRPLRLRRARHGGSAIRSNARARTLRPPDRRHRARALRDARRGREGASGVVRRRCAVRARAWCRGPTIWWPEVFWGIGQARQGLLRRGARGRRRRRRRLRRRTRSRASGTAASPNTTLLASGTSQATDDTARGALWEFVFGVDLVVNDRRDATLPIDEPLRHLRRRPATRPRRLRQRRAVARAARPARAARRAHVLRVDGHARDRGARARRFGADASRSTADPTARSAQPTDGRARSRRALARRSVRALLGGNRWSDYAAADAVDEHAVRRARVRRRDVRDRPRRPR